MLLYLTQGANRGSADEAGGAGGAAEEYCRKRARWKASEAFCEKSKDSRDSKEDFHRRKAMSAPVRCRVNSVRQTRPPKPSQQAVPHIRGKPRG